MCHQTLGKGFALERFINVRNKAFCHPHDELLHLLRHMIFFQSLVDCYHEFAVDKMPQQVGEVLIIKVVKQSRVEFLPDLALSYFLALLALGM